MTLVVSLGSSREVLLLVDRLLSGDSGWRLDDVNKGGALLCDNARVAFAFTGLAKAGKYSTHDWLLDTLLTCGTPSYFFGAVLQGLCSRMTEEFATNPSIRSLQPEQRRLSILFAGYRHDQEEQTHLINALVSNFQLPDVVEPLQSPDRVFHLRCIEAKGDIEADEPALVSFAGAMPERKHGELDDLVTLLERRASRRALTLRALEAFKRIAGDPQTEATIGRRITSIAISSNPDIPIRGDYHVDTPVDSMFIVPFVRTTSIGPRFITKDGRVELRDTEGRTASIALPPTPRNRPCPCGSGERYKNCHGSSDR